MRTARSTPSSPTSCPPAVIDVLSDAKETYELENPYGADEDKPSLRGLIWTSHLKRSYPENNLASNVLGFYAYKDRQEGRGYYGVEEYYDDLLAGNPMDTFMPRNPYLLEGLPEVPSGASLVLTIDREIQAMVEKKLDEAVEDTGSSLRNGYRFGPGKRRDSRNGHPAAH